MSEALRVSGSHYPVAVRVKAREFYLHGQTYGQIVEELGKTGVEVTEAIVGHWARRGAWKALRRSVENQVAREQLKRVKNDLSVELSSQGRALAFLQGFLQQYFMKRELDASGNPVLLPNGQPKMVPRGPADWPMDSPNQAVGSMLAVVDRRAAHVRLVTDLLGGALPAIEPVELTVGGSRSSGAE